MNLEYRKTIDGVFFRSAQIGTGSLIKMVMPFFEGSAQYESPIYIVDPTPDANWDAVLRPLILANTELSLPRLITVTDQTDIPETYADSSALFYDPTTGILMRRQIDLANVSVSGDVWSDNWIGKKVLLTIGPLCQEVDLYFTSNAYNPVVNIQISGGSLRNIVVNSDSPVRIKLGSESYQTKRTINIVASPVWNPKNQGISGDLRELSVTMTSRCSRIKSG